MADGRRIAVVDDDRSLTLLVKEALTREGWQVDAFNSAEELLSADPVKYDAIFLDLLLPGMWGSECVFKLRQMGVRVPILAVTGHAEDWDEDDLRDLGFNAILKKPFDTSDLMPVVEQALAPGNTRFDRAAPGEAGS